MSKRRRQELLPYLMIMLLLLLPLLALLKQLLSLFSQCQYWNVRHGILLRTLSQTASSKLQFVL